MEFTITQRGACSLVSQGYIKVVGKAHPNMRYPEYSLLPINAVPPRHHRSIIQTERDQMIAELKHRFASNLVSIAHVNL